MNVYKCLDFLKRCISVFLILPYSIIKKNMRKSVNDYDDSEGIVYVCHTLYHILVSCVKVLTENEKASILIYCDENTKHIVRILKDKKIFCKVIEFEHSDTRGLNQAYEYKKYTLNRRRKRKEYLENLYGFEYLLHSNVKIYNDNSIIGYYLFLSGKSYALLEDGLNCYGILETKTFYYHSLLEETYRYFFSLQHLSFGASPLTEYVEVNDLSIVIVPQKAKFIEYPKYNMFAKLSERNKREIYSIFDNENLIMLGDIGKEKVLLLTQPLFIDQYVKDENEQIELYEKIIYKYTQGEEVYIKKHPRDSIDYERNLKNVHTISTLNFPIEILNFKPNIRFKKVITVSSTAIDAITFADEKICIGTENIARLMRG